MRGARKGGRSGGATDGGLVAISIQPMVSEWAEGGGSGGKRESRMAMPISVCRASLRGMGDVGWKAGCLVGWIVGWMVGGRSRWSACVRLHIQTLSCV